MMDENTYFERLKKACQEQLYPSIEELSEKEKEQFVQKVETYTNELSSQSIRALPRELTPSTMAHKKTEEDFLLGEKVLSSGEIAVCLLAGGMGTRLGYEGPKGAFSIDVGEKKSLFQIFAEKIQALGEKYNSPVQLIIMTSPINHAKTLSLFKKNRFFGLKEKNVLLFSQHCLPFADDQGHFFFEDKNKLSIGPAGNGAFFQDVQSSEVLSHLEKQGVKHLQVLSVDNPLADPIDLSFVGYHALKKNEVTIGVIDEKKQKEKMGAIVQDKVGNQRVLEYVDYPEGFEPKLFNVGIYCLSLAFIKKIKNPLPLHKVRKKAPIFGGKTKEAWKFETFIFDGFDKASKVGTYLLNRELSFSPLKNTSGENGIHQVEEDFLHKEKLLS